MEPIFFRGQALRATKHTFSGTQRTTSPEETWKKIAPLAPKIGVTRVANITGLDRIGIPVTTSMRPAAKTLAVSSGKGPTLITAQVSGLMESLEIYCAEEHDPEALNLPYNELVKRVEAIPLDLLPVRKGSLFHPTWPERWIMGWDLFGQKEIAIPLFSVIMNFTIRHRVNTELSSFYMDSNGLASGNHLAEAMTSAIYELIERDAVTCHDVAMKKSSFFSPRIRLETIPYPSVQELLDKLARANIQCFLYDCTTDIQVPVFKCYIYDPTLRHREVGGGYGAHLDPEVAMIRAITEAVQGRALCIAGSRDDIFSPMIESWNVKASVAPLENHLPTIDARSYRSEACASFEEDIHLLMAKLKHVGLDQLIVYDLSQKELDVFVVRVIIPGLEAYYSARHSLGKRALAFIQAQGEHPSPESRTAPYAAHFPAGGLV